MYLMLMVFIFLTFAAQYPKYNLPSDGQPVLKSVSTSLLYLAVIKQVAKPARLVSPVEWPGPPTRFSSGLNG
jgi:hypothetical protein